MLTIPNFSQYKIDKQGRVLSNCRENPIIIKLTLDKPNDYIYVKIYNNEGK